MRLIIYNGKGGVGKTSVSAATALRLAKMGHRTIIMSVDTAHSLGDSLDVKMGSDIVNVAPNLDALELDIIHEMKTKWSAIKDYLEAFMVSQGLEGITADEMAIMPGMEMVAALLYVLTFKKEGKYDVVIIDTAPTGETLRLMSFPDVSNWYIDKVFTILSKFMGIAPFQNFLAFDTVYHSFPNSPRGYFSSTQRRAMGAAGLGEGLFPQSYSIKTGYAFSIPVFFKLLLVSKSLAGTPCPVMRCRLK